MLLRVEGGRGDNAALIGEPVGRFRLPDLVHDSMFSSADYLGKKEVAIVSYMGWF